MIDPSINFLEISAVVDFIYTQVAEVVLRLRIVGVREAFRT